MASKMRIWLQEKRKIIANKIISSIEISKSQDDEEEKIDTTKHSHTDPTTSYGIESKDLEAEKLRNLIKKVQNKAELLIKLCVPESWDESDSLKGKMRHIDGHDGEVFSQDNLSNNLRKIKNIQKSRGTVTGYENLNKKEVFKSCSSSILACLQ